VSYPQGNGDPACSSCKGRGVTDGPMVYGKVPSVVRCQCVLVRETLANLERGWVGLTKAERLASSPLRSYEAKNLWVTTPDAALRRHMRHVAARMGPDWHFKVVADKDLITAWLSTIAFKGGEILDPDAAAEAATVSLKYLTIEDLAEPPELLVIVLGVKAAKNVEMPQVLFETLQLRSLRGKPTWVIDQPTNPFRMGHICWSGQVQAALDEFPHLWLDESTKAVSAPAVPAYTSPAMLEGVTSLHRVVDTRPSGIDQRDLLNEAMNKGKAKKKGWGKR